MNTKYLRVGACSNFRARISPLCALLSPPKSEAEPSTFTVHVFRGSKHSPVYVISRKTVNSCLDDGVVDVVKLSGPKYFGNPYEGK